MPSLPSRMPYSAVRRFVPRKWRSFIRWSTPHFCDKEAAAKHNLQWSLLLISLLSLSLILLIAQILKQMKNISKIKERLSESNVRLTEQNREIIETNSLLTESNMVKEQYITQFFDLHSNYIDKFETYRKSLNRAGCKPANGGTFQAIEIEPVDRT